MQSFHTVGQFRYREDDLSLCVLYKYSHRYMRSRCYRNMSIECIIVVNPSLRLKVFGIFLQINFENSEILLKCQLFVTES